MEACVLVRLRGAKVEEALEAVGKIEGVVKASLVWGRYDLVAYAEGPDAKALSEIATKINAVKGVRSTETLIQLTS